MRILLLAMPDAANNFHRIIKVPSLGLCSIAASLKGHVVRIADLVLVHKNIASWLKALLRQFDPHLIGIGSMSFQYDSAEKVAAICRAFSPQSKVVLGGYHATLAYEELTKGGSHPFDFLIRGEGERAFPMLAEALQGERDFASVPGLSWREGEQFRDNPTDDPLDLDILPLPDRSVRLLTHFTYFGRKMDCVETSRGCTMPCTFCSIRGMYGPSFRCYDPERVIADLQELRRLGTESVLLVDDNITLDPHRFKDLAQRIIDSRLDCMEYLVQASVSGIAADAELIPLMARANFRMVFLGIESVRRETLQHFRKGGILEDAERAVRLLRKHEIAAMGGFIVGNPDDTREDVREAFRTARRLKIDLPYVQCLTPYPGTKIREELLEAGLVVNRDDLSRYTGFICNVKTRNLSAGQLNRILNWENIKMFFSPSMFSENYFVRSREKGAMKVLLNNFESVRGWFTGDQFRSRHTF